MKTVTSERVSAYWVKMSAVKATVSNSTKMFVNSTKLRNMMTTPYYLDRLIPGR
jgi:hypothetical protein